MAYYEKYRKEITQTGGTKYRISIYENRSSSLGSGYPYEIGGFVAANLVFQGQQSDVFQPVVKTSLELILVDVYDNPPSSRASGRSSSHRTAPSTRSSSRRSPARP